MKQRTSRNVQTKNKTKQTTTTIVITVVENLLSILQVLASISSNTHAFEFFYSWYRILLCCQVGLRPGIMWPFHVSLHGTWDMLLHIVQTWLFVYFLTLSFPSVSTVKRSSSLILFRLTRFPFNARWLKNARPLFVLGHFPLMTDNWNTTVKKIQLLGFYLQVFALVYSERLSWGPRVRMCVWESEVAVWSLPESLSILFFEAGSLNWTQSSLIWLGWLASKAQGLLMSLSL